MDWAKFLSREFLIGVVLIIIATVALFIDRAGFIEWAGACGGFVAIWSTTKAYREIKANGKSLIVKKRSP